MKPPPSAEKHNFLADADAYLKGTGGADATSPATSIENLLEIRKMLVTRRRLLAADVKNNSIVYIGRSIDICKLQELIRGIDEAIDDERRSPTAGLLSGQHELEFPLRTGEAGDLARPSSAGPGVQE